jgi:hypothetical protein
VAHVGSGVAQMIWRVEPHAQAQSASSVQGRPVATQMSRTHWPARVHGPASAAGHVALQAGGAGVGAGGGGNVGGGVGPASVQKTAG